MAYERVKPTYLMPMVMFLQVGKLMQMEVKPVTLSLTKNA